MPKYKDYYSRMKEEQKDLFVRFKKVHDQFALEKDQFREQYNKVGQEVVDVIRDWDRRLCSAMGKGSYSVYSQQLSEKFWGLVRQEFALIDLVGVTIKR